MNTDRSSSLIPNFRYRPEVDGLRALAVTMVIFYHANIRILDGKTIFSGGFIGVDIFFVISGYLITSLILKEVGAGTFSLFQFWERRIRRIMPPLAAVVLTTLVVGFFLMVPRDFETLGQSALWQSVILANAHFYWHLPTGYFTQASENYPLLHTWSLAVEEQFYLIMPLLLLASSKMSVFRQRRGLLLGMGGLLLLSLGVSIYNVEHRPTAAFYLLPSRAWEILMGSMVAILPLPSVRRWWKEVGAVLATLGMIIPCLLYSKQTPFPGLAALLPCFSTALFIWITSEDDRSKPSTFLAGYLFSARPVVGLGLISYSLYLWHWPLFSFVSYWNLGPPSRGVALGMVALSFVLAVLSWRYIESPFRKRKWFQSRKSIFAFGGSATVATGVLGVRVMYANGVPERLSPEARKFDETARAEWSKIPNASKETIAAGDVIAIGSQKKSASIDWLLWGDSHAKALLPAFEPFLKERDLNGRLITCDSVAPVIGYQTSYNLELGLDALSLNATTLEYIRLKHVANVALVANWRIYGNETDHADDTVPFRQALLHTVRDVVAAGATPWVFVDVPNHSFDVPRGLMLFSMYHRDLTSYCAVPGSSTDLPTGDAGMLVELKKAGARIVDPRSDFLSADHLFYRVSENGASLYWDSDHLSEWGAVHVMLAFLRREIEGSKP